MRSRVRERILVVTLVAGSLLFAASLGRGTAGPRPPAATGSALESPQLVFDYRAGKLLVEGTSGSARQDIGLLQAARQQFAGNDIEAKLTPGVIIPDYWEGSGLRLLSAIAATKSAVAVLDADRVKIRGVASDADELQSSLASLRQSLPLGAEIDDGVMIIAQPGSFDELCRRNFANALSGKVAFSLSSAELRSSSYALLDRIVEIADDCRGSRVGITGHSDASGDEVWNRRLSRARAQAVADYLVRSGIRPERLIVEGMGSAAPVGDNSTAAGRGRNRRIDFELR